MRPHPQTPLLNKIFGVIYGVSAGILTLPIALVPQIGVLWLLINYHYKGAYGDRDEELGVALEALTMTGFFAIFLALSAMGMAISQYRRCLQQIGEGTYSIGHMYRQIVWGVFCESIWGPIFIAIGVFVLDGSGENGAPAYEAPVWAFAAAWLVASMFGWFARLVKDDLRKRATYPVIQEPLSPQVERGAPLSGRQEALEKAKKLFEDEQQQ